MRKHLYQLALILALSATFAFAQTTPNASTNPNSATPMASQSGQSTSGDMDKDKDKLKAGAVNEDTIRRQVKEQLATNPSFSGVNVDVAKDGAVTLTGDVPSKDDRTQAKNLAQAVPGVKKVKDHLKVNASAVNAVGSMGTTSNQAAPPSTSGSIAGNTEAKTGVASGSAVTGSNPSGSASQSTTTQQSTTTSSTTAIPQSDVTGSATSAQTTGQTGSQPATSGTASSVNAGGSSAQVQQIQQVLQQQNITNVQVVNNNNSIQLVGTVSSQEDKDKAEQAAKQAAPGLTIQNNIQVSQSVNASGSMSNPPSATSPSSTTPPSSTNPPMGEATAQSSSQANLPPSASSQSSTTTIPQSDVTASQSTAPSGQTSASQPNTPFGNIPQHPAGQTEAQTGSTSDLQGQIEGAIKADTSVSGCNTNVNVTDTQIELTGTCPSGKEKQSVKRTAQSFAGNRKVVDHIKVTGKGNNAGTESMGTGAGTSTSPSSGTNPPTSSGTTPPQPPL